ncbi:MAG: CotH kinase family protein [Bacteroidota bacterium]
MKTYFTIFLFFIFLQIQAQVFNGTGGGLPDVSTSNFTISTSSITPSTLSASHGLVSVCIDINHTYVSDLNISLISPSGNIIVLIGHVGGGGQDFTSTCLNDRSSTDIASGTAPFTGVFKPSEDLGNLNDGSIANGIWTLSIRDDAGADTGYLNSWSLVFDTAATSPFMLSSSNLPIFVINTLGQTIIDEPKINCTMKVLYHADGSRNFISDAPSYDAGIGIEIRGNYSSILPQKPYGFTTQDISNNDSNVSLIGLPSEHDWILQSTYNDKSFVRNVMMFEWARRLGNYAPHTKYCEVVINNQYKGIYFLCEKIKRDANRVNIARLDLDDNAGDSLTGGYIFKHDYDDLGWDSYWRDSACDTRPLHYNYYYPSASIITTNQATYIKEYVDSFEVALFSDHFQDSIWGYKRFISQKTFVDYLILNELAWNGDGYKKSMFYSKDKNGKLKAGPIWDFDWALKFMPGMDSSMNGWNYLTPPCAGDVLFTPWFARLMEDTTFSNAVYCKWTSCRDQLIIDTTSIFHFVDSTASYLDESQTRHFNKWRILGLDSGSPEAYPIPVSFAEELNRFKFFLNRRIEWIDNNLFGNCYVLPVDTITVDTLGIRNDGYTNNIIQVYPNPTSDITHIHLSNELIGSQFIVSDMLGRELIRQPLASKSNDYTIDMSSFASGNYIISVYTNSGYCEKVKIFKK